MSVFRLAGAGCVFDEAACWCAEAEADFWLDPVAGFVGEAGPDFFGEARVSFVGEE